MQSERVFTWQKQCKHGSHEFQLKLPAGKISHAKFKASFNLLDFLGLCNPISLLIIPWPSFVLFTFVQQISLLAMESFMNNSKTARGTVRTFYYILLLFITFFQAILQLWFLHYFCQEA